MSVIETNRAFGNINPHIIANLGFVPLYQITSLRYRTDQRALTLPPLFVVQSNRDAPLTFPQARSSTQSPGRAYSWIRTLFICSHTHRFNGYSISTCQYVSNITGSSFYRGIQSGNLESRPTQLLSFLRWMMGLFSRSSSVWLERAL